MGMSNLDNGAFCVRTPESHIRGYGQSAPCLDSRPARFDTWRTNRGRFVMYDDAFGYWFAGLTDGEGCFYCCTGIRRQDGRHDLRIHFGLALRADDRPLLECIKKTLRVGRIHEYAGKHRKFPLAAYRIDSRHELTGVLIPLFDKYPLRSKKRRDYEIWRRIILECWNASRRSCGVGNHMLSDQQWKQVVFLSEKLRSGRKYERDIEAVEPLVFIPEAEQASFLEGSC